MEHKCIVLLVLVLVSCWIGAYAQQSKKNIILVLTDDQDLYLGGWRPMQKTHALIDANGATMTNWFVNTPVCCPSRSQLLSGRHMHNIRATSFQDSYNCVDFPEACGCMRVNASQEFEENLYVNYLQQAGYATGYFGKYLNTDGMTPYCSNASYPAPPGWDRFYGMCKIEYYNAEWKIDETIVKTGARPEDYTTSIIGNQSVAWLSTVPADQPFHLVVAPHAPHAPYTPAPWYADVPVEDGAPRFPSFNYSATDHVPFIATEPPLDDDDANRLDENFKNRWRALMSVDDIVEALVATLTKMGRLDDTYIFVTSDNGYHLGEFRLSGGKEHFYEFDIRVPMAIYGPGVPANSSYDFMGTHIDLAPTFLDIADISLPNIMDGTSILPMLNQTNTTTWRDTWIIEYEPFMNRWPKHYQPGVTRVNDGPNNTYLALRAMNEEFGNIVYSEYTVLTDWEFENIVFYEYYDIDSDPYELNNIYDTIPSQTKQTLHTTLRTMWNCSGTTTTPSTCHKLI